MNEWSDNEEQEFNPPPKSYRVSVRAKIVFIGFAIAGLALYGYMLVDRRLHEHNFLAQQEIAPIKLMPSLMPTLSVIDPNTTASINLSFADGNYTLLNIWATWCPPCQKEMPALARLAAALRGKIRVVALSIDDKVDAVTEFISEHHPDFTVLWDQDKRSSKFLGIEKYPETFLISPDGYLMTQFSGPRDWSSSQLIEYFLNVLK